MRQIIRHVICGLGHDTKHSYHQTIYLNPEFPATEFVEPGQSARVVQVGVRHKPQN
jgi:hypothetical protein